MTEEKHSRRRFIGAAAAPALGALTAASYARVPGANERIRIGLIGCGRRAFDYLLEEIHGNAAMNVQVAALCDVWKPAREEAAAHVRAWWPGTTPRLCSRHQDLLAAADVDAVVIAAPDFTHARVLAAAARAKKDAYCEKPMATNLADAHAALDAVLAHQTVVQIGTQRRSAGRWKAGARLVQSGVLGKVSAVETSWDDCRPRWARPSDDVLRSEVDWEAFLGGLPPRPFDPRRLRCWQLYKDYSLGSIGFLGSHLIDAAAWFMDDPYPLNAVANGGVFVWRDGREQADTLECVWQYPKGWLLRYSSVLGNEQPSPLCVFRGTRGTFDTKSWEATGEGGGKDRIAERIEVRAVEDENHVANWIACMRSRRTPNASVQAGHAHAVACILAFRALETGRRQRYDPAPRQIAEG